MVSEIVLFFCLFLLMGCVFLNILNVEMEKIQSYSPRKGKHEYNHSNIDTPSPGEIGYYHSQFDSNTFSNTPSVNYNKRRSAIVESKTFYKQNKLYFKIINKLTILSTFRHVFLLVF